MAKTTFDFKKDFKLFRLSKKVLDSLLVASIEGNATLPTIEQFILSEVINGTTSYIGGRASTIKYPNFLDENTFLREMHEYFTEQLKAKGDKLAPQTKAALESMLKPKPQHAPPDRPYLTTDLYQHFKGMASDICPVTHISSFSLSFDLVQKTRTETIPSFSEKERRDIVGIGRAMRPFINEDLTYIREHYHW